MHDRLIAMTGPAGAGKSTLAEQIAASLRRAGTRVDLFGEEEIFARPEFALVGDGFRGDGEPTPEIFEDAYRAWLTGLTRGTVPLLDWNPAGMVGDLSWAVADRARLRFHLEAVRNLAAGRVALLKLRAPIDVAIQRAAEQRGEEWLARYDQIARSAGIDRPDRVARITAWTQDHIVRTEQELHIAASAGWPIHDVNATGSIAEVRDQALTLINSFD